LSQLVLEETKEEYPDNSFWERQWVIFDGDFSSQFLQESLNALQNNNSPFIQDEHNVWSRFQYLLWREKEMLKSELLSVFDEKVELDLLWNQNKEQLSKYYDNLSNEYSIRSAIMMKYLQRLEATRFFFETRSLSQICPKSLSQFKIVHFSSPVFTCEDMIRKEFDNFSKLAEYNIAMNWAKMFKQKEYQKKVVGLVDDLMEQVLKKSFISDKTMCHVKLKDSLVIFEYILKQILLKKEISAKSWKGKYLISFF
jgi:hypothetical protein